MKINKRRVDLTTAGVVLLTGLSMVPYELEKIPIPPAAKPWLTLLGIIATPMLLALRNQVAAAPPTRKQREQASMQLPPE